MALISFKDVGVQGVVRQPVVPRSAPVPIGFKTPLELDEEGNSIFKMHFTLKEQISDNLRNLILTNHGERLALYDFGANLRPLLTDWSNKEDFDREVMLRIKTANSKYMPFVELQGYESLPDYEENIFTGKIRIFVAYTVPSINLTDQLIEVDLFVI